MSNQPAALKPFQPIDLWHIHMHKHALRAHALIFIHRWHLCINPVDHSYTVAWAIRLIMLKTIVEKGFLVHLIKMLSFTTYDFEGDQMNYDFWQADDKTSEKYLIDSSLKSQMIS